MTTLKVASGALAALAIAGGAVLASSAPAQAINIVSCNNTGYTRVDFSNASSICYANGGTTSVPGYTVRQVWGGNNAGSLNTTTACWLFYKWSDVYPNGKAINIII
ncbi:hypothetical protein FHU41_002559 [Psychromicrobium silvestre]|uniref:Streptomyces killer toxin-like beta/gamma crystallin domain-containing protein n=1 Tax=Psychromicrobium silvestre TaxID=1645614 RepID=A0A7Y9LVD0_9MICC|nr:hypothetical protein [Psychromicrobium silvestre]NYE96309.1 hypothetical protein [Psychromicrobium silvestre]